MRDGQVRLSARPAPGNSGVVPVHLILRDADGRVALEKYAAMDLADAARNRWTYDVAVNDPPGRWRASLRNLLTGAEQADELLVPERRAPAEPVTRLGPAVVFDEHAYRPFAARAGLLVVPGQGCQAQGRSLAAALKAEVRSPEELRKDDTYPDLLDPAKNKGVWMMPRWQPLALTVGRRDVVLLGVPQDNVLIADLNSSGMLPRAIDPATLGPGEGMVQYCWSPFDLDRDAAVLSGYDEAGLAEACRAFLAAAGVEEAAGLRRAQRLEASPAVEALPATERPEGPVETIRPDWHVRLDDGVRELAAGGGLVAAGGMDSRLSVFDESGQLLWRRDFDYRVLGVDVSPDGALVAAAAFPRTYLFDRGGGLRWLRCQSEPSLDDVEGLAVRAVSPPADAAAPEPACLLAGTWTGRVEAVDRLGRRLWQYPPPPPEPKKDAPAAAPAEPPPPLQAVRKAAFLPDGSALVAAMNELVWFDAAGQPVRRVPVDRLQDLRVAGGKVIAPSFKKKLLVFDLAGTKLWEQATEGFIMAADATADGATIAVALFGGEVVLFDGEGKCLRRARLPMEATLTGLAFSREGDKLLLATWDGDVLAWRLR